jgi:hypothetical protein
MPLILSFNTQAMRIKSIAFSQKHSYAFPKNLTPCRDSNPGLLSVPEADATSTAPSRQTLVLKKWSLGVAPS